MGPRRFGTGRERSYRAGPGFKAAARASHLLGVVQGTCGNLSLWPARPLIADRCVEPCREAEPDRDCVDREVVDRFECGPLPFDRYLARQNREARETEAKAEARPARAATRSEPLANLPDVERPAPKARALRAPLPAPKVGRLIDLYV